MKILIADDEIIVRIGVKALIERIADRDGRRYEVIGEAATGKEALDILRENRPDIVITDIKMPVMDGLQLIRHAANMDKRIKFIVLSGYDDVHLVKEAMKLGAMDYVIKLDMDQELLGAVLASASRAIEEERNLADRKDQAEMVLRENLNVLRQNFLRTLIHRKESAQLDLDLENRPEWSGLDLDFSDYRCLVIELYDSRRGRQEDEDGGRLFNLSFTSIVDDILNEQFAAYSFEIGEHRMASIISGSRKNASGRLADLQPMFHETLERVLRMLREYFDIDAVVGVSGGLCGLKRLSAGYRMCLAAVRHSFYAGLNQVIYFDNIGGEQEDRVDPAVIHQWKERLLTSVELRDIEAAGEVLGDVIRLLETRRLPRERTLDLCYELTYLLINKTDESVFGALVEEGETVFAKIQRFRTLPDITDWFSALRKALSDYWGEDRGGHARHIVRKAEQVIRERYREHITLKDLAEELYISPGYLSNVFRKVTGTTVTDYINDVRIRQAQKLLNEGKYKVYEIAEMVGFSSSNYFIRVYKAKTGVTPRSRHFS